MLGFVKLTLLTFLDEENKQHVWATGLKSWLPSFELHNFSKFVSLKKLKANQKVSPSDLLYMNKLLEFSTNTKLDAPNAKLEGLI